MPRAFRTSIHTLPALVAIAASAVSFSGANETPTEGMHEISCLGGKLRLTAPKDWGLPIEEAGTTPSSNGMSLDGLCGQQQPGQRPTWTATVTREEHRGDARRSLEDALAVIRSSYRDVQWLDGGRVMYRVKSEPFDSHDRDWRVCSMPTARARRCANFRFGTNADSELLLRIVRSAWIAAP